jgi:hypothetical protein
MKLLSRQADSMTFELRPRERELMAHLLSSYPVQNPRDHRIAKPEELEKLAVEQQMLVEALTEQQESNRKAVAAFIERHLRAKNSPAPTPPDSSSCPPLGSSAEAQSRITISLSEADWLLEVLNDIRVGCWNRMGSPDEIHSWRLAVSHPREFAMMEMSSLAQMILLEGLNG